uniref:Uncharacterized protein n=1 Tax=Brassica oleracea TaxID=3712 RepID=A0A3P6GZA2_BRAOL|nr:unnamed protein product [Brassica oleracea]
MEFAPRNIATPTLTSIPRASYPFLFDHSEGASQNRKTHIHWV